MAQDPLSYVTIEVMASVPYIDEGIYKYSIYIYIERWTLLYVTTILNVFCGPIPFVTSLKAKSSKEKREETIRVYMGLLQRNSLT